MRNFRHLIWVVFFGSIWGLSEVVAGNTLFNAEVPQASVWLSAWALFILAVARGLFNKPGSSTLIGAIAVLFRAVNTAPFFCHLLGIFLLGFAFDLAATLLMKRKDDPFLKRSMAGVFVSYSGYTLFALIITYIIRYEFWVAGGLTKVIAHIFVSGSLLALIAILIVPLGYRVGQKGETIILRYPRWVHGASLLISFLIWTLGRLVA